MARGFYNQGQMYSGTKYVSKPLQETHKCVLLVVLTSVMQLFVGVNSCSQDIKVFKVGEYTSRKSIFHWLQTPVPGWHCVPGQRQCHPYTIIHSSGTHSGHCWKLGPIWGIQYCLEGNIFTWIESWHGEQRHCPNSPAFPKQSFSRGLSLYIVATLLDS